MSSQSGASKVNILDVGTNEHSIIRVCHDSRVSLVYGDMTIDFQVKNGVLQTFTEFHGLSSGIETQPASQYDSNGITQEMDYNTPDDPITVQQFAGGGFGRVNDKHASMLEKVKGLDVVSKELEFLAAGDTQLDDDDADLYAVYCKDSQSQNIRVYQSELSQSDFF